MGAGAAGLEAARELTEHGRSVLVLESRDRVGGRILTHHDPRVPLPIELGAEFIHGEAPVTEELLGRAGLSAMDLPAEHASAHRGSLRRTDYWTAIDRVLKHIDTKGADESVASFLAGRPGGRTLARERGLTRRFVEGFHAADVRRISAHSIAPDPGHTTSGETSRVGRVTRGYGALVAWLARDLGSRIRLNCEVKSVTWRAGRAAVETRSPSGRSMRCTARAVIVTAPVGVLGARKGAPGAISIEPEPPRLRQALAGFDMGCVVRVVVWFRDFPWQGAARRFNFLHLAEGPFQVLWTAQPLRWPLAVLWCGGPTGGALSRAPRAVMSQAILAQLAVAFGISPRRVKAAIHRVWWHDWDHDPYARGAYTYHRVGAAEAHRELARPQQQTLFFAGEATEAKGGTVEAALASGRRAARQVLRALNR